jgi:exonuclease SbcC
LRTFATKVLAAIEKEKDRQESIVKLKADRAEKLRGGEKWHLLAREIGSATGDKFNRFAQQLTLEHLIHLANIRLQRLTQRYRLHLAPESEQLAVLDADLAGVPRSVKTLSGGETFLISLGLALALSDLASKNVRIHNLFIDEGFGTLDPETLETTLTVLDLLQADDERSIGVISHVEALKERIAAQVQLIPDGRGNSRIQVQG